MKFPFLLVIIWLCSLPVLFAQTVNLDVLMGDKKIGDITATKTVKGKTATETLSSKVSVTMLFAVNVESSIASEFKDGKLVKTEAVRTSNVKTENKTTSIIWDGTQYTITKERSEPETLNTPITYTLLDLYLAEPAASTTQVFSEQGAHYLPLTLLEKHRYQLQINDTKKDIYQYNDKGKLVQIETVIAMNKVVFKVR